MKLKTGAKMLFKQGIFVQQMQTRDSMKINRNQKF